MEESPGVADSPCLGVLITYYGERALLRECLESLFSGTVWPDEVLVFDDASPYPAVDYVPEGLPVRVIRSEQNRGPSHGRNVLLRESRAAYVHFHDADDLFRAEWCARVREQLSDAGVDAVFTEIESRSEGALLSPRVLDLQRLARDGDLLRYCIRGFMLVPSGTYRRDLVKTIGGYRGALWQSEDYDFHVRLAAARPSYVLVDEPLVVIRIRRESRSQNRWETWTCAVQAVRLLAEELPDEFAPELAEKAATAGSALYQMGAVREAAEAFALARHLGPPRFPRQRTGYRVLARLFGPMVAERVGALYRSRVSEGLRIRLQGRGVR